MPSNPVCRIVWFAPLCLAAAAVAQPDLSAADAKFKAGDFAGAKAEYQAASRTPAIPHCDKAW
jgi:hypothetical protein